MEFPGDTGPIVLRSQWISQGVESPRLLLENGLQDSKVFYRDEYSHLVLKKHSKHSKIFGTSLNKSLTFFFKIAQACSMGFKSGE